MKCTRFVVVDRRVTSQDVLGSVLRGDLVLYEFKVGASAAKYPTELVRKITFEVEDV